MNSQYNILYSGKFLGGNLSIMYDKFCENILFFNLSIKNQTYGKEEFTGEYKILYKPKSSEDLIIDVIDYIRNTYKLQQLHLLEIGYKNGSISIH